MLNIPIRQVKAQNTPLSTARKGLQRSEKEFAQATDTLIHHLTEGANALGEQQKIDTIKTATDTELATTTAASSIIPSVINIQQAETAYKANLTLLKVADDLAEKTLDILA